MKKNITIADVADALGVSKTTVSRAISGKGRIGDATREKVLNYIDENDYVPNQMAKGLATNKTYNIGVVMQGDYSFIDLPFFQECLIGVHDVGAAMDYDILLTVTQNTNTSKLERIIRNHKVDGIILLRTFMEDKSVEYLKKSKIPFVVVGSSDYENVIQVDNDHLQACKELTSILLMKHITKIALIGGNENYVVTRNRLKGFKEAFKEQNIPISEDMIYLNMENPIFIDKCVDDVLKKNAQCILCMDDAICLHVLNRLDQNKIDVPKDIKVASFYNSFLLENHLPSITSLTFDAKELGMLASTVLFDSMEGKEVAMKTYRGYEVRLKDSTK